MPLDPFTALGLASNVVQFVDFTSKLISETREIYKAGSSTGNIELDAVTKDLQALTSGLKVNPLSGNGAVDNDLASLAAQCNNVADELVGVLELLQAQGTNTKWKSFTAALRNVMKNGEVEALVARIGRLQKQLNTRVLVTMQKDMR
jgi:hypothetical protein